MNTVPQKPPKQTVSGSAASRGRLYRRQRGLSVPADGPDHLQPAGPGLVCHRHRRQDRNLGGPTGAWLADVFFSLVGYAAYLFPLLLAYRALIILLERHEDKGFDWLTFGIRALGLVLVMIAGTALAAMNDTGTSALPQGAGGILGQAIGELSPWPSVPWAAVLSCWRCSCLA